MHAFQAGRTALGLLQAAWRVLWLIGVSLFHLTRVLTGHQARAKARARLEEAQLVLYGAKTTRGGTSFERYEARKIAAYNVTDKAGESIGVLKMWFAAGTRVCHREFSVSHPKMLISLGSRRLPLHALRLASIDSLPILREQSLREVEAILKRKLCRDSQEETPRRQQPACLVLTEAPRVSAFASVSAPASSQARAPVPSPTERMKDAPAARPRVQQVDEGYFKAAGHDVRSVDDRDSPGQRKQITQFYVDVVLTSGDNPGQPKRLWGQDLERAMGAVNPLPGDLVRVSHLGRTYVPGSGSGGSAKAFKNLYDIERINK